MFKAGTKVFAPGFQWGQMAARITASSYWFLEKVIVCYRSLGSHCSEIWGRTYQASRSMSADLGSLCSRKQLVLDQHSFSETFGKFRLQINLLNLS